VTEAGVYFFFRPASFWHQVRKEDPMILFSTTPKPPNAGLNPSLWVEGMPEGRANYYGCLGVKKGQSSPLQRLQIADIVILRNERMTSYRFRPSPKPSKSMPRRDRRDQHGHQLVVNHSLGRHTVQPQAGYATRDWATRPGLTIRIDDGAIEPRNLISIIALLVLNLITVDISQ
jgi:hypothetical protein